MSTPTPPRPSVPYALRHVSVERIVVQRPTASQLLALRSKSR